MPGALRTSARVGQWSAWALAVVATALAATAVALPLVGGHDYLADLLGTPEVVVAVSFSVTGALLVGHPAARRIGWLLVTIGLAAALFTSSASYTAYVLGGDDQASLPAGEPLALATAWVSSWAWLPSWLLVATVLPQVVPHGRPLPGRWRPVHAVTWAVISVAVVGTALAPGELGIFTGIDNPLGVEALGPVTDRIGAGLGAAVLAVLAAALVSVVVRVRRADGTERRQVGWVGYAVALTIAGVYVLPDPLVNLAVLLVPAGITVAATRYRLYDLDLVVNRSLVLVLLVGGGAIAYLALVGWVGALVGTRGGAVPFFVAFALALGFHPARLFVQRWVDRLFFGRRGDPEELRRDLDLLLREAQTPREALARGIDFIAGALRLSGVGVEVALPDGTRHRHDAGAAQGPLTVLPLELHGELLGEVRVGSRRATGGLSGTDLRVLESLVGPLAAAAYALRLSGRLEESRRDLLATREDERRRLRRDLHDSLGPQLASAVMGLDVLRSSVADGELQRAESLSAFVSEQLGTAVVEVRRLVSGLRPPVLDDLGLVGAIEVLLPTGEDLAGLVWGVDARGDLSTLSAAVEVAAYRIAAEAVTNALRHSGATRLQVTLAVDDAGDLELTVVDNGTGMGPEVTHGVGIFSMRERAEELGGSCRISSTPEGTSVVARMPGGQG